MRWRRLHKIRDTIKSAFDRIRRDKQGPAVIVIGMAALGSILILFGASLAGEVGLLLVASAAGVFATVILGRNKDQG